MSLLKIMFAGTPDFAVPSLKALLSDSAFQVTSVITQPDRPAGRGQKLKESPVKTLAKSSGIPVWQPKSIKTEWKDRPSAFQEPPDVLVVVAYGQILSPEILAWPRIAPVNLHASLLPKFRGAAPIQNAILAGEGETGVTVQRMVTKLDAGPTLSQERITLEKRETFSTLHDRLSLKGAALLSLTLKQPLTETPQDESKATHCRKLTKTSGDANPETMSAEDIDRMVRALVPWPGVRVRMSGKEVMLISTSLSPGNGLHPLPCRDSILYIDTLLPPGKRPMKASDWIRGHRS